MIYAFVRFCRFKWCPFLALLADSAHWWGVTPLVFTVSRRFFQSWAMDVRYVFVVAISLAAKPTTSSSCNSGVLMLQHRASTEMTMSSRHLNGCLKVIVQMAPLRFHRTTDVLHPVGPAAGVVPRGNVTQTVDADALTPRTARSWVKTEIVVAGMVRGAIGQARSAWMLKPMGSQQPSLHFLKTMSLWTLDTVEVL